MNYYRPKNFLIIFFLTILFQNVSAQNQTLDISNTSLKNIQPYKPTTEAIAKLEENKKWFRDAKFGMFIHWGPYAKTPLGEASSARGLTMSDEEYEKLADSFNPVEFDPNKWVSAAKEAGMKYIVLTSMHADGFCMWDTKEEPYNIMNTPYKKDVLRMFSDACQKQNMPYGFYYSFLNWHYPTSTIKGREYRMDNGKGERVYAPPFGGRPAGSIMINVPNPNVDTLAYADHCARQVAELVKNYGPLTTLWGDVPYKAYSEKEGTALVSWTRSLQPGILINDRFFGPFDYTTPEQEVGRFSNNRLWESCMVIGGSWSHIPNDAIKTSRQCLQMLLGCVSGGGNLLLDVGPDELGRIDPQAIESLRGLGVWISKYGESIYGTSGGPFKPWLLGGATCKDNTVYLHIQNWFSNSFRLPAIPAKVLKVTILNGGKAKWMQDDSGIVISVPPSAKDKWDTVIALQLDRPATTIEPVTVDDAYAPVSLLKESIVNLPKDKSKQILDGNPNTKISLGKEPSKQWIEADFGIPTTVSSALVTEGSGKSGCRIRSFVIQYEKNGVWKTCAKEGSPEGTLAVTFTPVTAKKFRLLVTSAVNEPSIAEFGLYNVADIAINKK